MALIGNNILSVRIWQHIVTLGEARGFDADSLGDAAGISAARMQALAQGATIMRVDDLTGFSQALGMPISELLEGVE